MKEFLKSIIVEKTDDNKKKITQFLTKEWRRLDQGIFGRNINDVEWGFPIDLVIWKDQEHNEILGAVRSKIRGGVWYLSQIVVNQSQKGQGIGKYLMEWVESEAIQRQCHKIRLSTSERHKVLDFYRKFGYQTEATLENDYFGLTWYYLSKLIP